MSEKYRTDQESFWAGNFGDAYVERNNDPRRVARRTALFAKILSRTRGVSRILELGANIGQNLLAIRNLIPDAEFGAVEINEKAIDSLRSIPNTRIFPESILDFDVNGAGEYDLTLASGVLIHVDPKHLPDVYARLFECSSSYIALMEYYNPTPVEVVYRGHEKRLFKRDFAGEMLSRYPDLELVDYGFQYHGDYNFPADDGTWFLMRKNST
ncbi:MAG: pseudaminic acid biosynthesis-associated methylase [Gammaproteobacteria bacterium]|nr:pseudaminic acid biosynthesis-associated methylase [Gammaproteobacteria bacterium]